MELGDYQGAISDFDTALRLEPDDAEAYKDRAKAKMELSDYQGAISDLDAALRLATPMMPKRIKTVRKRRWNSVITKVPSPTLTQPYALPPMTLKRIKTGRRQK